MDDEADAIAAEQANSDVKVDAEDGAGAKKCSGKTLT